ncbi:hypothetical protein KPL37_12590 [Clostridium frigoris]|uniref:Uncharacterized protein n=1 Tax=Clostridium frigoris TaxID=205327 RepID=A0ABS6BUK0_9CLOT|nr:hypothetical protein [Clostridium frigoris]MBU3160583.1 hypothetical protein [Clostridium frigoris]
MSNCCCYCCIKALNVVLQQLQNLKIKVQITANGTENAVPSSSSVSTGVTNSLVLFGNTIISLCAIEDIRFETDNKDNIAQIIKALEETKDDECCIDTLRKIIEPGGNIGKITSTTHENLINASAKPIIATGLGTALLAEGTSGFTKYKFHLVALCQISALEYIK